MDPARIPLLLSPPGEVLAHETLDRAVPETGIVRPLPELLVRIPNAPRSVASSGPHGPKRQYLLLISKIAPLSPSYRRGFGEVFRITVPDSLAPALPRAFAIHSARSS